MGCVPCIEPPVEESDPDPTQNEEKKHEGEGEDKPWAEVYEVTFREGATDTHIQDIPMKQHNNYCLTFST